MIHGCPNCAPGVPCEKDSRKTLFQQAERIRPLVQNAVKDLGSDLSGFSVVDLVLDNIEDISSFDAKCALVVAGVDNLLSDRLVRSYSQKG